MNEFISHSPESTENFAAEFSKKLKYGDIIAFTGDLGAGKTAFCRGLLFGLGYEGYVTSPTFAIANEYKTNKFDVVHFDMYRILDLETLFDIGFDDYLDGKKIILIEWSENISNALPSHTLISIKYGINPNDRIINISEVNIK